MTEALLDNPVKLTLILHAMDFRAVCNVLVDRFRERVGFLKDHPHPLPERDNIRILCMDILIIKRDLTGDLYMIDEIITG